MSIVYNVNEKNINGIMESDNGLMSEKRIILIKKFLIGKVNLIKEQLKI